MRCSIRVPIALAVAFVGGSSAGFVRADTITATLTAVDPDAFGNVFLQGEGSLFSGVGTIVWQGSASNATPYNGVFDTYCIDLIQNIQIGGTYSFVESSLAGAPKAGAFVSAM